MDPMSVDFLALAAEAGGLGVAVWGTTIGLAPSLAHGGGNNGTPVDHHVGAGVQELLRPLVDERGECKGPTGLKCLLTRIGTQAFPQCIVVYGRQHVVNEREIFQQLATKPEGLAPDECIEFQDEGDKVLRVE
jgi:hypothetical protein